ncbi:hypothetical protein WA026_021996 [Henosepilachna vigintioctopunctata]
MELWRSILKYHENGTDKFNRQTDKGIKYANDNELFSALYAWNAKYAGCSSVKRYNWTTVLCLVCPGIDRKADIVFEVAKHPNAIASECDEARNRKYPSMCGKIEEKLAEKIWSHLNITFSSAENMFCVDISCKIIMICMLVHYLSAICK